MEGRMKREEKERISMNSEENYDLGYQLSETDQSASETTLFSSSLSGDSFCRESSGVSISVSVDESSYSGTPSPMHWPGLRSPRFSLLSRFGMENHNLDDLVPEDLEPRIMKERFSKLLLGEDMSGNGKGVSTAVAISNAITNLYASVFGNHLKLEPLHPDKKLMWKREMNCLLSVCDYIVEYVPSSEPVKNGFEIEVMVSRPRSDISVNLPALKKLDAMLLDTLDNFEDSEFWYVENGSMSTSSSRSGSFRRLPNSLYKEEKWWLPVPCVHSCGLSEKSRKHLQYIRGCTNQIHKAANALNSSILSEMELPDSYISSLPKNGKAILGDAIYSYMTSGEKFMPDNLLDRLTINSEHEALKLADKFEASMYTWRHKAYPPNPNHSKSSWNIMKDFMSDIDQTDKNHVLSEKAESLLFALKRRYPELSQTSLDASKILNNKDVGKAILESYSRVLEGLTYNIVAWIEDVLFVDKTIRMQQHRVIK